MYVLKFQSKKFGGSDFSIIFYVSKSNKKHEKSDKKLYWIIIM